MQGRFSAGGRRGGDQWLPVTALATTVEAMPAAIVTHGLAPPSHTPRTHSFHKTMQRHGSARAARACMRASVCAATATHRPPGRVTGHGVARRLRRQHAPADQRQQQPQRGSQVGSLRRGRRPRSAECGWAGVRSEVRGVGRGGRQRGGATRPAPRVRCARRAGRSDFAGVDGELLRRDTPRPSRAAQRHTAARNTAPQQTTHTHTLHRVPPSRASTPRAPPWTRWRGPEPPPASRAARSRRPPPLVMPTRRRQRRPRAGMAAQTTPRAAPCPRTTRPWPVGARRRAMS